MLGCKPRASRGALHHGSLTIGIDRRFTGRMPHSEAGLAVVDRWRQRRRRRNRGAVRPLVGSQERRETPMERVSRTSRPFLEEMAGLTWVVPSLKSSPGLPRRGGDVEMSASAIGRSPAEPRRPPRSRHPSIGTPRSAGMEASGPYAHENHLVGRFGPNLSQASGQEEDRCPSVTVAGDTLRVHRDALPLKSWPGPTLRGRSTGWTRTPTSPGTATMASSPTGPCR